MEKDIRDHHEDSLTPSVGQGEGLDQGFGSLKRKVAYGKFTAEGWLCSANAGKTKGVN